MKKYDLDFDFTNEDNEIEKFNEDYFLTTNERTRFIFNIEESFSKLLENDIIPKNNETIRAISPANGWSSCSLLMALINNVKVERLIITTLRVGKKELDEIVNLKRSGKIKNVEFILSGLSKENKINGKKYEYTKYFEEQCKENKFKFKYIKNHSKVILIDSNVGKYIIETSSNFNENPKVEQFIISRSDNIYDYYIKVFSEIGVL